LVESVLPRAGEFSTAQPFAFRQWRLALLEARQIEHRFAATLRRRVVPETLLSVVAAPVFRILTASGPAKLAGFLAGRVAPRLDDGVASHAEVGLVGFHAVPSTGVVIAAASTHAPLKSRNESPGQR
jgi:hypothetical protein